jgi:hypothetical protein
MYKAFLFAGAMITAATCSAQPAPSMNWSLESSGPQHDGRHVQLTIESRWARQR